MAVTRALLLIALACASASIANAIFSSTSGSISFPYAHDNGNAPAGSADLPMNVLGRNAVGVNPDQIHVIYWGNCSYLISWATGDGQVGPIVIPPPAGEVESMVMFSHTDMFLNASSGTPNATGISLTYLYDYSKDVTTGYLLTDYARGKGRTFLPLNYASPVLHHVLIEGLLPGTTYYYKVGDPRFFYGWSDVLSFTTLGVAPNMAPQYPFRLAVLADVGQTYNTTELMGRLMGTNIDALALIGDFTYADNYDSVGCMYYNYLGVPMPPNACPWSLPEGDVGEQTYQPRWDTWSRLWEPVLSRVPMLFANGNHEIEELPTGARFTSVNARFPAPPADGLYGSPLHGFTNKDYLNTIVQGQPMDDEFDPMGAYKNMFYSAEVPGATMVFLTSFIGGDTFDSTTVQYQWFEKVMKAVNRTRTPWVIVNFHFPMYTSYAGTYKANECFRQAFEPLFYKYGVDIVFNGHVHAYERSNPVYNYTLNNCGAVHITVGDGGNNEGVQKYYQGNSSGYCQPGKATTRGFPEYQPQACFAYNADGSYCPQGASGNNPVQPVWSAYRNPSWGFGVLTIMNSTSAHWLWNNTDNGSFVYDEAYFTRNPACLNGVAPPQAEAPPPPGTLSPTPAHHPSPVHKKKHPRSPAPPRPPRNHHKTDKAEAVGNPL